MYRITAEKNPIKSLQISYSVFFQWEDMKILQKKLSHPVSSYCQLINESIAGPHRIENCERIEARLKRNPLVINQKLTIILRRKQSIYYE